MPDIRGLVTDPDFKALSPERKRAVLQRAGADPGFIDELVGVSPDLEARRSAITRPVEEEAALRSEGPANTPNSILAAAYLGGEQPVGSARKEMEAGGVAGALSVPALTALLVGGLEAAPYVLPAVKTAAVGAGTAVAGGSASDVVSGISSGRPLTETVERAVAAAPNRAAHGAVLGPIGGKLAATPAGQAALSRLGPLGRYLLEYLSKSGQLPLKF